MRDWKNVTIEEEVTMDEEITINEGVTIEEGITINKGFTIYRNHFPAPIKVRSQCYALLHCDAFGHLRTWHTYNAGKTLYRDRNLVVSCQTT